MKNRFSKFESESTELINLTPLIDVLFTVLVLFIVISPFLDIEKIELAGSGAVATSQKGGAKIKLHVKNNEEIRLNEKIVSPKDLPLFLKELKIQYPYEIPELMQDKRSHFGTYLQIKHALESAGFEEMDLVVKPE